MSFISNMISRIYFFLKKRYYLYQCRKLVFKKDMLENIDSLEKYEKAMFSVFEDNIITLNRLLVLQCFTERLDSYHHTNMFMKRFNQFKFNYDL